MSGYDLSQPIGQRRGFGSVVRGVNPAAGSNFVLTLDSRWVWRMTSCVFTLTTDANVANRYVTVEYAQDDGAVNTVNAAAVLVTAASTQRYAGSLTRGVAEWNTGSDVLFPLDPVFLWGSSTITIRVGSIQVGDTLTLIRFVFDRFPTDIYNVPGVET